MLFNNGFRLPRRPGGSTPSEDSGVNKNLSARVGKNDELFASLKGVEAQVDSIVESGRANYISGIKANILKVIFDWFNDADGRERFFFLFGNMGTGKSFFSSHLYSRASVELSSYPPVIYSSQQSYSGTTSVENMLLVTARRLCASVPEYADYCRDNEIADKSISRLVENILVLPLEGKPLQKPVLVIIDGLDEYSRDECSELLDALNLMRGRINPSVRIFFTSRPETYIRSHLPAHAQGSEYTIEAMQETSSSDCMAFINSKAQSLGLELSEAAKSMLVEKSNFCLKYLKCVFDDVEASAIEIKEGTIESLPVGLLSYYREQLIRYFTDDKAYREEFRPFLEIICAAHRPLTVNEAADLLGISAGKVNNLILRAGTLIYKVGNTVYLYQSESIKPYLSDERYCPENYLVSPENGSRRIIGRLRELIEDDDLESNEYLMQYAPNHILDLAEENDQDAWQLLFVLADKYKNHRNIRDYIAKCVISKPEKLWAKYLRKLQQAEFDRIAKDAMASVLFSTARSMQLAQNLIDVAARVSGSEEIRYYELLFRARLTRLESNYTDAITYAEQMLACALSTTEEGSVMRTYREGFVYDEMQRTYRALDAHFTVMIDCFVKMVNATKKTVEMIGKGSELYPIVYRSHSVTLDQLGRLFRNFESRSLTGDERIQIAEALCPLIGTTAEGAEKKGFFIKQAITTHEKSLEISKYLQSIDSDSKFRLYDLHFPLLELSRLYNSSAFPQRNVEKAISYLEDCLRISERLAEECATADVHDAMEEKYLANPIKICSEFVDRYIDLGNSEKVNEYILKMRRYAESLNDRFPDGDNAEMLISTYLKSANAACARDGIENTVDEYDEVAKRYLEAAERWEHRQLYLSASRVYDTIADRFSEAENYERAVHYRRRSIDVDRIVHSKFASEQSEQFLYYDMSMLADELIHLNTDESTREAEELLKKTVVAYYSLARRFPSERNERGPLFLYDNLFALYLEKARYDDAKKTYEDSRVLSESLFSRYPNSRNALSVVITYQHEANCLVRRYGADFAEERCVELMGLCREFAEEWRTESVMSSECVISDYLANAFKAIENYDKESVYRQKSVQVDEEILEAEYSQKFDRITCTDIARYIIALEKSTNPPSAEELVEMRIDLAKRYAEVFERTGADDMARAASSEYFRLQKKLKDGEKYDDALRVVLLLRAFYEKVLERNDTENAIINLNLSYEYEAEIVSKIKGKREAFPLYRAAFDRAARAALRWDSLDAIRSAVRTQMGVMSTIEGNYNAETMLSINEAFCTFAFEMASRKLPEEDLATAERWFFSEIVAQTEFLAKLGDFSERITDILSVAFIMASDVVRCGKSDDRFWHWMSKAHSRVMLLFGMEKITIKHLLSRNPRDNEAVADRLEIALAQLNMIRRLVDGEEFEASYANARGEYLELLKELRPEKLKYYE